MFTSAQGGSALHRGGVLTLVAPGLDFDFVPPVLDPTLVYIGVYVPMAMLAYDGLVGVRRTGGVDGAQIVPGLATSVPQPSASGLTYTFHLRRGVRYSTGAPVLAGDIRRGIERVVVRPDSAPEYYTQAIVGAGACGEAADKALAAHRRRPDCHLSRGIVANDRTGTITFHLTRRTPEFTFQLSMGNASAVPQDTPVDLQPGSFLPATGPYKISSYQPMRIASGNRPARHGRLELVRNPFFLVWSRAAQPDGYPDRIVLDTGYTDPQAVARVTSGQADMLWLGAPDAAVDQLKRRFGSQLHASTTSFLDYMFLDTSKPAFNSRDARRAVAFALDRAALTNGTTGFLGQPTCQVIPPNFAAHQSYCPFTAGDITTGRWTAPDRATAQELVAKSGTRGAEVVFVGGYDQIHRAESERIGGHT